MSRPDADLAYGPKTPKLRLAQNEWIFLLSNENPIPSQVTYAMSLVI